VAISGEREDQTLYECKVEATLLLRESEVKFTKGRSINVYFNYKAETQHGE
jgi:hypothetical protein